jgi:molybdopterin-biosynthesis enzyme MoeA-like protein
MIEKKKVKGFGLIIIGTEILEGRGRDSHFENTSRILKARNQPIRYVMVLSDDPGLICGNLKWAMTRPEPFFRFGGIGSTPDDYTRKCAADAAGLPLQFHEEGIRILEERFGSGIKDSVKKMVEFPEGAALIPNPINRIPGFSISNGHFLPGFPSMAAPMTEWVLDNYYLSGEARIDRAIILPGAREADLVPMMEAFIKTHPELVFSSLPRFVDKGTEVCIGIQGRPEAVEAGYVDLIQKIEAMGREWVEKQDTGEDQYSKERFE